jgi:perosamine synthetase
MILHSKPWVTASDLSYLKRVLDSRMLAQGEETAAFEKALSRWYGIDDGGVAVASGAAALLLALLAFEIRPGDEVVLPTYVCRTVLEAVITAGATPVCCDVGPQWVVTPDNMAPRLTDRTRALIVPHMYGIFAPVASFRAFGIPVIEDCAQALAGCGQRRIEGDIAIFSFNPTKCLATGEGGMAISAAPGLVAMMRAHRDGKVEAPARRLFSPLSDLAAGLGLSQLARYEEALARRAHLAQLYRQRLAPLIPDSLPALSGDQTMWFRFPLWIPGGLDACQELFAHRGVHVRQGVDNLLHRCMKLSDREYPAAVRHFQETVSLPLYPALTGAEHTRCVEAAEEIFSRLHRADPDRVQGHAPLQSHS